MAKADETTRYDLRVNDFTELKVTDNLNVVYHCHPDSAGHVVFFARPDQASAVILQPNGTKLELQLSPELNGNADEFPTVTVYSSILTRAENDGKGHLKIATVAPGEKISLNIVGNGRLTARSLKHKDIVAKITTGNGEIVLAGEGEKVRFSSLGTGQIQADELAVHEGHCRIMGTGSIGVNASDFLTVSGMGSGTVYYIGKPQLKNRTLGVKTVPFADSPAKE